MFLFFVPLRRQIFLCDAPYLCSTVSHMYVLLCPICMSYCVPYVCHTVSHMYVLLWLHILPVWLHILPLVPCAATCSAMPPQILPVPPGAEATTANHLSGPGAESQHFSACIFEHTNRQSVLLMMIYVAVDDLPVNTATGLPEVEVVYTTHRRWSMCLGNMCVDVSSDKVW